MKIFYSQERKQIQISGEECLMFLNKETEVGFHIVGVEGSDLKVGICGFNVVGCNGSKSNIATKIKWIIKIIKFKM